MIDLEKERYESLPEFVREPYSSSRTTLTLQNGSDRRNSKLEKEKVSLKEKSNSSSKGESWELPLPKSDELEALWPGVDHEFLHVVQRRPSFYLSLGFMAGAIASILVIWIYSIMTHSTIALAPMVASQKQVVVTVNAPNASKHSKFKNRVAEVTTLVSKGSNSELVVPSFNTYEIKEGDTLAAIAFQAYHRVSPRLLDEICKVNGMQSADVLSLGQKLTLPEYRPSLN